MALDKIIFQDKTLSDLFKEIYDNSRKKDKQITSMVGELKDLIEGIDDATLVVPMIKEYMEIGVKNDEHLIKLAQIFQRMEANTGKGGEDVFDPMEIQAIIDEQLKIDLEPIKTIGKNLNPEQ
jgi:hypothetical protein